FRRFNVFNACLKFPDAKVVPGKLFEKRLLRSDIGNREKQSPLALIDLPLFERFLNFGRQVQKPESVCDTLPAFAEADCDLPLGERKFILETRESPCGF